MDNLIIKDNTMRIEDFFRLVGDDELNAGILFTVSRQLEGKSVGNLLKLMSKHNVIKLVSFYNWELNSSGEYRNTFTSKDNSKGKYLKDEKKVKTNKGIVNAGVIFDGANIHINPYYINPHINPFKYLEKEGNIVKYGILTINEIHDFFDKNGLPNIDNMQEYEFKEYIQYLKRNVSSKSKTIFISHSYKDRSIVKKIAIIFLMKGFIPYLDWLDFDLDRNNVTAETGLKIRGYIDESDYFVYIASKSHGYSKWMPWELGVSFGQNKKTYILPADEEIKKGGYMGQEYIKIHDHLIFNSFDFIIYSKEKQMGILI